MDNPNDLLIIQQLFGQRSWPEFGSWLVILSDPVHLFLSPTLLSVYSPLLFLKGIIFKKWLIKSVLFFIFLKATNLYPKLWTIWKFSQPTLLGASWDAFPVLLNDFICMLNTLTALSNLFLKNKRKFNSLNLYFSAVNSAL